MSQSRTLPAILEILDRICTRIKVHESKFKSKLLRIREGSAFYIHMMNKHSDVEIEGKALDAFFEVNILKAYKKSRIRETPTLSTDADSRTDTNLKRLHDFFFFKVS